MTSFIVFNFVVKQFILQVIILFISEFLDFQKYFYQHFFESVQNLNKLCVVAAKGRLNVPTALGHMLVPSAQRWADNRCCRETPPPDHRVSRPIKGDS